MAAANIPDPTPLNSEEHWPQHKLDLGYFTAADRCPLMVRRRARGAFELFLHLAYRFIHGGGEPVVAEHEELCAACGVVPDGLHSSSEISRLLRSLRETYRVIDYRSKPGVLIGAAIIASWFASAAGSAAASRTARSAGSIRLRHGPSVINQARI